MRICDAIVVGSGINGLAAAMLSRDGWDVGADSILEQLAPPGQANDNRAGGPPAGRGRTCLLSPSSAQPKNPWRWENCDLEATRGGWPLRAGSRPSVTCVRPGRCGRAGHRPDRYRCMISGSSLPPLS